MASSEQQNKALMTAGLNLIAQALSIYDGDLRLRLCNLPFQKMFNLPAHLTRPGASFEETIRHLARTGEYGMVDDVEAFVRDRVEQARAFQPHYMERTRSNGHTISVEGSPLPEGGWVTVYTDISVTKRSEELLRSRSAELSDQLIAHAEELSAANRELAAANTALEETKRQLTEIEARTRMTTEMMPAHIAHLDCNGVYIYSNRRLNSVMPGLPSDIMGRPISEVLGPVNYSRIAPYLAAAYEGENSTFEFTETHDSRRIRAALTPDGSGGVYILSMDVTEETQARVALQQSRRRAMAAQLTSGLAHDFSNLLTIILGMQGKLARMGLPDEAAELVEATRTAARRGGRLLNRIADMTGKRSLRPQATDMHGLLRELRVLAEPSLPQAMGLSILDNLSDAPIMLDPGLLQDALLNLILNARDSCDGSGQITIHGSIVKDTWLQISVRDTGRGFSEEALKQALDPFFTTKGTEGSGLGLTMVYDMTKLGGGELQIANAEDGGAIVSIRLPLRRAHADRKPGLTLLVEDDPELRGQIRNMLMAQSYLVIEAASVDEALVLLEQVPGISLILSDIKVEGDATGVDLVDRVTQKDIPTFLMTSFAPTHPLYLQGAARAPIIRKPFSQESLVQFLMPETTQ